MAALKLQGKIVLEPQELVSATALWLWGTRHILHFKVKYIKKCIKYIVS